MRKTAKHIALILSLALCLGLLGACSRLTELPVVGEPTPTPAPTERAEEETPETADKDYLAVGYSDFGGSFSPFYAKSDGDRAVVALTSARLLTTDRSGAVVYDAAENSTYPGIASLSVDYDAAAGNTVYTWKLRDDVYFSDGKRLTADDVVFSYYVHCDYSYTGSEEVASLPIVGLRDYRSQTTEAVYNRYANLFNDIYAAGTGEEAVTAGNWTAEQHAGVWAMVEKAWEQDAQAIVAYCVDNYLTARAESMGYTPAQILESEGLQVVFGMWSWGYGEFGADGSLRGKSSGTSWDLETQFPTAADFANEMRLAYDGNAEKYWGIESVRGTGITDSARELFIRAYGSADPELGGNGVQSISGIKKTGDFEVSVTLSGDVRNAAEALGIYVAPLHHYADENGYDYENNRFGYSVGEFSRVKEKSAEPLGAGPYIFAGFETSTLILTANEHYYLGEPGIKEVQLITVSESRRAAAFAEERIDIARLSLSLSDIGIISDLNAAAAEQETAGIELITYPGTEYAYIGINSAAMRVGDDSGSEESKALRKAFATLFAVYRLQAVESVYGEYAEVSSLPLALSSGSLDYDLGADGEPLYTAGMTQDARVAQAKAAAVSYLKAAGYIWDETVGRFTEAPEGAQMEYSLLIPESSDSYAVIKELAVMAGGALAEMGLTLSINEGVSGGNVHMRGGAWNSETGNDFYNTYHSSTGSFGNMQSERLDELTDIMRELSGEDELKALSEEAASIIEDWAVMVTVFRDCDAIGVNAKNVNLDTLTSGMSRSWSWINGVHKLELNLVPEEAE